MFSAQNLDESVLAERYARWQGLHQNGCYREPSRTKRPQSSESTFCSADADKGRRARRLPLALSDDPKRLCTVPAGVVFVVAQSRRRQTIFHAHRNFTSS